MVTLEDVEAAAARIAGKVRRTPLVRPEPSALGLPHGLLLKLESLQVSGSFKARGATNKLSSLPADELARGLITASGGNHGAAVAHAAKVAGVPATVVVPQGVSPLKVAKIRATGADLIEHGAIWDESNQRAQQLAKERGQTYVHPFMDPLVIAGQGTVALEVLEEAPGIDTLLIAVGGGGLIAGMAVAAKAIKPGVKIIGIEPTGAPTLKVSLDAGRVVRLERITTRVPTMASLQTGELNLEACRGRVAQVVLVEDEQMQDAARALWLDQGIAADLSGAAAIAALMTGAYRPEPGERVCALVCGAGGEGVV